MMQTQTISEQQHRKPATRQGAQHPFFAPAFIQPKLSINQPNDAYEKEADAVAEKVMRMPATDAQPLFFSPKPIAVSPVQRVCEHCKNEEKKEEEEEAQPVQRKPEKTFDIRRKCAQCEDEEKGLQRKESGSDVTGMTAPPIVNEVISSSGQPMDKGTRNFMESRFGYDFGDVQIHNDAMAQRSSANINALAYTHGNHVVFGNGHYQPHTDSGKKLLAHELTHVVQQKGEKAHGIQRQPNKLPVHRGGVNQAVLTKVPREKWDEQIEREYRKRGDDLRANSIRNCRLQGGDACVHILTIEEVHHLFDIVNENKGDEHSILLSLTSFLPGGLAVRALAHVVVGLAIDLFQFTHFQKALKNQGYIILENALGLCIGGCHIQDKSKTIDLLDCTPSDAELAKGANEEYELKGNGRFQPTGALDTYIRYTLSQAQEVPVKVRFGNLGKGVINITGIHSQPTGFPFGAPGGNLMMPQQNRFSCFLYDRDAYAYFATLQNISFTHPAFDKTTTGNSLVMGIEINASTITGKLGNSIAAQSTGENNAIDYSEAALLPAIYGEEFTGENDNVQYFRNDIENGQLAYVSWANIHLANQQNINGIFSLTNEKHFWNSALSGNVKGLDPFEFQIERTPKAVLFGDFSDLQLDKEWSVVKKDLDGGKFTRKGLLRASYKSGHFELFGSASYASQRVQGDVNIAVTNEAEAQRLFLEHDLAQVTKSGGGKMPTIFSEVASTENLALTAWGTLKFTLISKTDDDPAALPGAAKPALEGVGAFVVSPDGYVILSGKLKMPAQWQFTPCFDYDKNFLKNKIVWAMEAAVPGGTVNIKMKLSFDVHAHLNPLTLYQIDISGVYSNHPHPAYRSEVDITPHFYISGCADAIFSLTVVAAYKALGLFTVVSADGNIYGIGEAHAYIDAAPTIRKIWTKDKPAAYALEGVIHTGGKLTFTLTGDANVTILGERDEEDEEKSRKEMSEHYHIGSWTLGSFGVKLQLKEYIIGAGKKPDIDYRSIAFGEKQQNNLAYSVSQERESKSTEDDNQRRGGFQQTEKGKRTETGVFGEKEPTLQNPDADLLDNTISENFLMKDRLHQLSIAFSGTRGKPKALLEMASDKEPLTDKIVKENKQLDTMKSLATSDDEKQLLALQQRDLAAIGSEAAVVTKSATEAAQKAEASEQPVVAGFDRIDDRISEYADKYETSDLGEVPPVTTAPIPAPSGTQPAPLPQPDEQVIVPRQVGSVKEGDLLSVPYKNSRGRAVVIEITDDFVKIKISSRSRHEDLVRRRKDVVQWILINTFKAQLASKEIFVWSDLRTYLMANRPAYKKGLVQKVWNAAIQSDGKVRDPNPPYEELTWIKSKSRFDQWHMGHKPAHKYSNLVDQLVNEEISWDKFIEEYNKPDNYWPELPSKNMGHGFEAEPEPQS